jgi:hypothetical protein
MLGEYLVFGIWLSRRPLRADRQSIFLARSQNSILYVKEMSNIDSEDRVLSLIPIKLIRVVKFRIGINVGDIVVEDGDTFGDGLNVAARLKALPNPVRSVFRRGSRKMPRAPRPRLREPLPAGAQEHRSASKGLQDHGRACVCDSVRDKRPHAPPTSHPSRHCPLSM